VAELYDGFISYSHAADDLLAPRLQSGLQRFAKPWWKRRAVRIFRDESSLSANPHLWSSITEALDSSGWFVLLLSPDAAQSEWVNQEITYWVENRDPKRILPVVTDGTFGWQGTDVAGDAVPDALRGVFTEEPRWVDVRWAKDEDQLDLQDPRFADAIADVASTIRGIPKDDLASEEVRQHRRTVRTAWAAGVALLALTVVAVGASIQSARNADEAERQAEIAEQNAAAEAAARADAEASAELAATNADEALRQADVARARELASEAIGLADSNPELATLLAIHAIDTAPGGVDPPKALINALWRSAQADRLIGTIEPGSDGPTSATVSDSGDRIFVSSELGVRVQMYDADLNLLWEHVEETSDSLVMTSITPDGSLAAVAVVDSSSDVTSRESGLPDDGLPNRLLVFDGSSGSLVKSLEFPDCLAVDTPAFSSDGKFVAVGAGLQGCERNGSRYWVEVFDTSDWTAVAFLPTDGFGASMPEFAADGKLFVFHPEGGPLRAFSSETFEPVEIGEIGGRGDITNDGTLAVTSQAFDVTVQDIETGAVTDLLGNTEIVISLPHGIRVSPDQHWVAVGTFGRYTSVFDLATGERRFRFPSGPTIFSAFDSSRQRLFTGHSDGSVKIWDLGDQVTGVEPTGELGAFTWVNGNNFTIGSDVGALAAIDPDTGSWSIRFFDLATGDLLDDQGVTGYEAIAVAENRFAVDSTTGEWVMYDVDTGTSAPFLGCVITPDGLCEGTDDPAHVYKLVRDASSTKMLAYQLDLNWFYEGRIFELDGDGSLVRDLSDEPLAAHDVWEPLALASDIVWARRNEVIMAMNVATGDIVWERVTPGGSFQMSPSGETVAVMSSTSLLLVDVGTLEERELAIEVGAVRGMSFSPDESELALGTADGLVIIDLDEGAIGQTLLVPGVSDAYWLSENSAVIGTNRGVWGVVSFDTEAFLKATRSSLRRSFAPAECATYGIDPCPTLEELQGG
jgi:WD40 repeat protein